MGETAAFLVLQRGDKVATDDQPSREELLRAKRDLQEQLDIVSQPMRSSDYDPGLVARLRAMIADIDEGLEILPKT